MAGALKDLLARGEFIVAPGVFEMFSAKIADRMGFKALYMTGYGISASHLGVADAGLVTYRDMVERARTIAQGTTTPLIADADTGFGGLLNVRETVRGYEAAGVQAIQIEDQEMPKKCGHTPNRRVVPLADAVKRIEVAVESRRSADFLVIARTDARTGLGMDEALQARQGLRRRPARTSCSSRRPNRKTSSSASAPNSRAQRQAARQHGADRQVAGGLGGEAEGLRLFDRDLSERGHGCRPVLRLNSPMNFYLKEKQNAENSPVPAYDMKQLHELVGFPDVWDFEKRHVETK